MLNKMLNLSLLTILYSTDCNAVEALAMSHCELKTGLGAFEGVELDFDK